MNPMESLQETIARCTKELDLNKSSKSFVTLADTYRKMGRYEEAIEVVKNGLTHHPTYVPGKVVLAQCLFENGDLQESRDLLEAVVRVSPDHLLAMKLLGTIFFEQKMKDQAIQVLDKVLVLDPEDKIAAQQRKQLQEEEVRPNILPSPTLAQMYKKQGHVKEAMDVYRALLKQEPTQAEYLSSLKDLEGASETEFLNGLLKQINERRRTV